MRAGVAQRPGPELNLGPRGPELAEKGAEASLCGVPSLAASCLCALPPAEAPSQQHLANHVCVTSSFRRVRLCAPMDHSLSGSSVHETLQARTLQWAATLSRRGPS